MGETWIAGSGLFPSFLPSMRLPALPMVTWFPISTLAGKPDSREATVEMTAWSCTFVTAPTLTALRSPVSGLVVG